MSEGARTTRAALQTAMSDHDETLVEIYHPSERAYEINWEFASKSRKQFRRDMWISAAGYAGLAVFGIFGMSFISGYSYIYSQPEAPVASLLSGVLAIGIAILTVPLALQAGQQLAQERRLGYSELFKKSMKYRKNAG